MTELLDYGTTYRISAYLFLIMPLITWGVLGAPWRSPILVWCLGGVFAFASLTLISLQGAVSEIWTHNVGRPLLLASFLLLAQALRMDIQKAWPWRWVMATLALYAAVIILGFEDKTSWGLAVLARVVNSAGLVLLTASAWMVVRHEQSRNARLIAMGYGLMAFSMLLTALDTLLGNASLVNLQSSPHVHLMGLVSLVMLLMTHMGYLGLALERSLRANRVLRQSQIQAQQWRERNQTLTLLDRQRALSVLANSLGHDILQHLTSTQLHAQLTQRLLGVPSPEAGLVTQSLNQTLDGLHRSTRLVERIRSFLRPVPAKAEVIRLQSVVLDIQDLLRQEMMYRQIDWTVTLPETDVWIRAETLPVMQALVQVLRNAMQAVQDQDERRVHLAMWVTARQAHIEVTDSGPGFSAAFMARKRAETLPAADTDQGLGLFMTQGILAQFGGHVQLDNADHGGARVTLSLPLSSQ